MNKAAFDVVYKKNLEKIYRVAKRYSGDHHAAEEITQTVFMTLYKYMDNINEKAVNSWLFIVTKHMALNYNRVRNHEILMEDILYGEEEDAGFGSLEDEYIKKENLLEHKELADSIFSELYRVNPRWHEAVMTAYYLGMPQKEVAEIMGIKLEVLHSMLRRAKIWIKKRYEEQYHHLQ